VGLGHSAAGATQGGADAADAVCRTKDGLLASNFSEFLGP